MWIAITVISGLASLAGYGLFQHSSPGTVAFVLAFAGGAILTMLADTMMPEAHRRGGKLVGVVTTLGSRSRPRSTCSIEAPGATALTVTAHLVESEAAPRRRGDLRTRPRCAYSYGSHGPCPDIDGSDAALDGGMMVIATLGTRLTAPAILSAVRPCSSPPSQRREAAPGQDHTHLRARRFRLAADQAAGAPGQPPVRALHQLQRHARDLAARRHEAAAACWPSMTTCTARNVVGRRPLAYRSAATCGRLGIVHENDGHTAAVVRRFLHASLRAPPALPRQRNTRHARIDPGAGQRQDRLARHDGR